MTSLKVNTTIGKAFRLKSGKNLTAKSMVSGPFKVYGGNGLSGMHDKFNQSEANIIIGRVGAYCGNVHKTAPKSWITDNALYISEFYAEYDIDYLVYLLRSLKLNKYASQSGQPLLSSGRLRNIQIPLPPLPEQRRIAARLDAADQLRRLDAELVAKYGELKRSLFLEMFGDPVVNERGWEVGRLANHAAVLSGITKGRKRKGGILYEHVPYLRVANVQDKWLDLSDMKEIEASSAEIERYSVTYGDLLLTEGGDPDKLGRGAVWQGEETPAIICQNHIFRVRQLDQTINPMYLQWLIGSAYGKRYFLSVGKQTTGIATINKTQLLRFPVQLPPVSLQTEFASQLATVGRQQDLARIGQRKGEEIFWGVMGEVFA